MMRRDEINRLSWVRVALWFWVVLAFISEACHQALQPPPLGTSQPARPARSKTDRGILDCLGVDCPDHIPDEMTMSLTVPNKPDAANPAIASRLQSLGRWRGVADPGRSAASASWVYLFLCGLCVLCGSALRFSTRKTQRFAERLLSA